MQENKLKAAFGKVKITPEEPAPLQGYDPTLHIADPEKDILDDLYARILILDDGLSRQVIVSVDCCLANEAEFKAADPNGNMHVYRLFKGTFPEGTRSLWAQSANVKEAAVSVHATHTHSAPEHFTDKYTSRIAATIAEMVPTLRPVRIRATGVACNVSVNRRPKLQHNDLLPIDHSLNLIVFETDQGQPLGAIVNCAVHPTLLINPYDRVSGEFVGLAMSEYESSIGEGFVSLFIQGFSGDVGPRGHYRDENYDTYPWVERMAHQLFEDIQRAAGKLQLTTGLPLKIKEEKIALPTREGFYKPFIDVNLHGFRIGDILLLSVSCEVFNGYIDLLKPYTRTPFTLFAGVANGYNGYLPTVKAFRDGLNGYEMNTTPYDEKVCEPFIRAAAELVQSL